MEHNEHEAPVIIDPRHAIARQAMLTVLQTLDSGDHTHRRTLTQALIEDNHLQHAIDHLQAERDGDRSEPHIRNAMSRLAMHDYQQMLKAAVLTVEVDDTPD